MIRVVHPGSGSLLFTHTGSRIQGLKRHRIPDPEHCCQGFIIAWNCDKSRCNCSSCCPFIMFVTLRLSANLRLKTRIRIIFWKKQYTGIIIKFSSGFGGDCKEDSAQERSGQCGQSQSQWEADAAPQEHNSSLKSTTIATSHEAPQPLN